MANIGKIKRKDSSGRQNLSTINVTYFALSINDINCQRREKKTKKYYKYHRTIDPIESRKA